MAHNKNFPTGTVLLFGVFLIVMLATYLLVRPSAPPPELQGLLRSEFRELQPFKLTDHNNQVFDRKRLQGKWSFVFFGYTSCPDVCPTTLHELNAVQVLLTDAAGEVINNAQFLLVSVDPQRDTTEKLAEYVTFFNPEFVGATSDKSQIDSLAAQFSAGYVIEPETSPGQYTVAHTGAIFLVDPFGRLIASFSQPHYSAIIATQFEKIRQYFMNG